MDIVNLLVQAVDKGGWTGYVLIAFGLLGALLRGSIISRREYSQAMNALRERYDEMKEDRDEWQRKTGEALSALEHLTSVMEGTKMQRRGR